ncbi:MAG: barstar family protein [Betaproteobacteria bacterium]|jgi:RNAse (barnase) inhibitor barstar|nr:MAG: barstar family protein [Betaproteobacteria bacterium]TMH04507.1 MAG: barstar family protein [Betaproteobacteria bacterium]TMH17545.1 MAG: barstar family protein [Betaproteobacteria bacterium]
MKLPDLAVYDEAGVRDWHGDFDTVKTAAGAAKLLFHSVDAAHADSKSALLAALAKGLKLPEHFGSNWDALADCLEDGDWLGSHGMVIAIRHAANYRKAHAADWETLSDILSEAAEYWRERHKPFWVFIH